MIRRGRGVGQDLDGMMGFAAGVVALPEPWTWVLVSPGWVLASGLAAVAAALVDLLPTGAVAVVWVEVVMLVGAAVLAGAAAGCANAPIGSIARVDATSRLEMRVMVVLLFAIRRGVVGVPG
jgi:hypothetical protein